MLHILCLLLLHILLPLWAQGMSRQHFFVHSLSWHLLLGHALPHKVEGWLEQLSALGGELLQSGPELCGQVLQAGPRWPVFISDFKPGDQVGGGCAERLHASIGDNLSTYGGACMCMWLGALHVCCMFVACLCMFGCMFVHVCSMPGCMFVAYLVACLVSYSRGSHRHILDRLWSGGLCGLCLSDL